MKILRDRVAVVTGAGSGIGREVARELSLAGARVAALDLRLETAQQTVAQIATAGGTAAAFKADVSNRQEVEAAARAIREELGPVAILVNNAGIMVKTQPMLQAPYSHFEQAVAVNIFGMVHCTYAFLPQILEQREGSVVNVASMGGLIGWMRQVPYTMTKFAVRGFSEALRMELLDSAVRVTVVYPGHIATNVTDNSPTLTDEEKVAVKAQLAKVRATSPVTVARKIVKGIRSGQARVLVSPETYVIDAIARLLPGSAVRLLHPLVKKMLLKATTAEPA